MTIAVDVAEKAGSVGALCTRIAARPTLPGAGGKWIPCRINIRAVDGDGAEGAIRHFVLHPIRKVGEPKRMKQVGLQQRPSLVLPPFWVLSKLSKRIAYQAAIGRPLAFGGFVK